MTKHSPRPSLVRIVLVVALAAATVLLGTGAAQAQGAAADRSDTGWIRLGHLSPGTPTADVVLTPFSGGRPIELDGVDYGDVSRFTRAPAGLYTLSMRRAGSDAAPMLSRSVRVDADAAKTVVATGPASRPRVQVLDDDLSAPPAGTARVRLVSATSGDAVNASIVGGQQLADDVQPGQATGYADVPAQTWAVRVSSRGEQPLTSKVRVKAGSVNTLFVLDTPSGLRITPVMDSTGATTTPQGGVETGGGGLARTPSATAGGIGSGALLAEAGAVLVAAGAAAVLVRRRSGGDLG